MKSFQKLVLYRKFLFFLLFVLFLPIVIFAEDLPAVGFFESMWEGIGAMIGSFAMEIMKLFSILLSLSGIVFDNLLAIGLSPAFFQDDFVYSAWASIRNLANAIFILVFIYLAFSIMLNLNSRWKNILVKTIIVALLMNFSLFGSRLIIDFGNITARVFYNSIGEPYDALMDDGTSHFAIANLFYSKNDNQDGNPNPNPNKFRSVSAPFNNFVSPQSMFGVKSYEAWQASTIDGSGNLVFFLFTVLLVIVYITLLSITLLKGGFMFLSRIVWLIFYIAISPLALASMLIPNFESYWKVWLKNIFQKSFCIVVYLFFIWLALIFMSSNLANIELGGNYTLILLTFIFKAIIVFTILDKATQYGGEWCGDTGKWSSLAFGAVGKVGKIAGAAPLAFARNKLGALGDRVLRGGDTGMVDENGNPIRRGIGGVVHGMKNRGAISRWAAAGISKRGSDLMSTKIGGKSWQSDMESKEKIRQEFMKSMSDPEKKAYQDRISGKVAEDEKRDKADKKSKENSFKESLREQNIWKKVKTAKGDTLNEKIDSMLAVQSRGHGTTEGERTKWKQNRKKEILNNVQDYREHGEYLKNQGLWKKYQVAPGSTFNEKIDNTLAIQAQEKYPGNTQETKDKRADFIEKRRNEILTGYDSYKQKMMDTKSPSVKRKTAWEMIKTGTDSGAAEAYHIRQETDKQQAKDEKERKDKLGRQIRQKVTLEAAREKMEIDQKINVNISTPNTIVNIENTLNKLAEDTNLDIHIAEADNKKDKKMRLEKITEVKQKIEAINITGGELNIQKALTEDFEMLNKAKKEGDALQVNVAEVRVKKKLREQGITNSQEVQRHLNINETYNKARNLAENMKVEIHKSIDSGLQAKIDEEYANLEERVSDLGGVKKATIGGGAGKDTLGSVSRAGGGV